MADDGSASDWLVEAHRPAVALLKPKIPLAEVQLHVETMPGQRLLEASPSLTFAFGVDEFARAS